MRLHLLPLLAVSSFALTACGETVAEPERDQAAEFASRINSGSPNPAATPARIAPVRENAVPGVFEPGTATDPDASICDATKMGPFLGQLADEGTRSEIMQLATSAREVRFVSPGPVYIKPDPTSSRLNIMLDATNVIRDVRCG